MNNTTPSVVAIGAGASAPAPGSIRYNITWAQANACYNRGQFSRAIDFYNSINEPGMAAWVQIQAARAV